MFATPRQPLVVLLALLLALVPVTGAWAAGCEGIGAHGTGMVHARPVGKVPFDNGDATHDGMSGASHCCDDSAGCAHACGVALALLGRIHDAAEATQGVFNATPCQRSSGQRRAPPFRPPA
jgi:hypothetical protein